ncbi:homeobox protein EMX1-like [Stegodyphus dumicola]|uniref:homeobox protein EMX1-like n=1 Tax=Stegodyphus dumicola TaxID=202533 RepID=UPI0015A8E54B|nr:homeobox protein EMX1-like [Stegodyphus dumicola]
MMEVSNTHLLETNKTKQLRFSIDALMGKKSESSDSASYPDDSSSPLAVKDYSIPKIPEEVPQARLFENSTRSPQPASPAVLIPIPTFPAGVSPAATLTTATNSRHRTYFPSSSGLFPQSLPRCLPSMDATLAGMFFREPYQVYPWYQQRYIHNRYGAGPDIPAFLLPPFRKAKRIRTAFTASQLMKLESAFDKNHYVTGNERKQLADNLGLSEHRLKFGFKTGGRNKKGKI